MQPATSSAGPIDASTPITACPLCGSAKRKLLWTITPEHIPSPKTFSLWRCAKCRLAYTSPRPTEAELVQLYDKDFYGSPKLNRSLAERLYNVFFRGRRKQIERFVKSGRLLDVGCGDGRFVGYMADRGWDTVGFDFSPTAQALSRQQANPRVRILGGQLSDHHLAAQSFDLITLWQVLEHIAEPLPLLRELARLLKPGGLIVVAVPNLDSIQAKIAGERWWGLDVPRHLSHYAPGPLRRALTDAGFLVRRVGHYSFRYSPYALYHSLMDRFFTRRDFVSNLAKRTLPTDISKNELGYNVAMLTLMSPLVVPVCILDSLISSGFARGGFIEAYATVPTSKAAH